MTGEFYSNSSHGARWWPKMLKPYLACTVWHAWKEAALRTGRGIVTCSWTPRTEGCHLRDQQTLHWGLEKVVYHTGTCHEGFSPSAFRIACLCSDTLLFRSQMSWDLRSAILEKNLEGTLASAGTLSTAFHEPLTKSHTLLGPMDSAVFGEESCKEDHGVSPASILPPLQPLAPWLSSEGKH